MHSCYSAAPRAPASALAASRFACDHSPICTTRRIGSNFLRLDRCRNLSGSIVLRNRNLKPTLLATMPAPSVSFAIRKAARTPVSCSLEVTVNRSERIHNSVTGVCLRVKKSLIGSACHVVTAFAHSTFGKGSSGFRDPAHLVESWGRIENHVANNQACHS